MTVQLREVTRDTVSAVCKLDAGDDRVLYLFVLVLCALVLAAMHRLTHSRFGKTLVGMRDNEGRTAIAAGKSLSDAEILGMKWLADGVLAKIDR